MQNFTFSPKDFGFQILVHVENLELLLFPAIWQHRHSDSVHRRSRRERSKLSSPKCRSSRQGSRQRSPGRPPSSPRRLGPRPRHIHWPRQPLQVLISLLIKWRCTKCFLVFSVRRNNHTIWSIKVRSQMMHVKFTTLPLANQYQINTRDQFSPHSTA